MCRGSDAGGRRCPNQHERLPRSPRDNALRQRTSRYARRITAWRVDPRLSRVVDEQLDASADASAVRELRAQRRAARRAGDAVAYELLTVRIDAAQFADANQQLAVLRWREGS